MMPASRILFISLMPTAADKYSKAIELYRSTDLTIGEISRQCGVTRSGLAAFIQRNHRQLMMQRNGLSGNPQLRLRQNTGQRPETRAKYREAIEACDSEQYLNLNVSQIARIFNLDGTALANQLRAHYPDIIPRREAGRRRMGIADNRQRGMRREAGDEYAEAVQLLRDTHMSIPEASAECGVSLSGLRQHILFYHKNLVKLRNHTRRQGQATPRIGEVAGNGQLRTVTDSVADKYAEAVELYRATSLPLREIADKTGVNLNSFRHHLRLWHRQLMFERRGVTQPAASDRMSFEGTKRYSRVSAQKYAEAIGMLHASDLSTEAVAKKFGFVPEVFRAYLKEHEPELYESLGMMTLTNGRQVLKRSYDKYAAAISDYADTTDSLRAIALRHGLTYNSLSGFVRRNLPELIERRKTTE